MNKNIGKILVYIGIPIVLLMIALRFVLYYFKSDGFNGMSLMFPLLIMGVFIFALFMSGFFAAWVYQDCRKEMMTVFFGQSLLFSLRRLLGCLFIFCGVQK